jgi:hypothetical protein
MIQKPYPLAPLIFFSFVVIVAVVFTVDILWLFDKLYVHRVRMDDSRLILSIVKPWVDGALVASDLWNDHHPAPFAGAMYILSYEFESLNFRLWKVFIGLSILLQAVAFSYLAWKDEFLSAATKILLVCITFLVLMNGNASIRYEWNLVGLGHFYLALTVPLLISLMMIIKAISWQSLILFTFFALINLLIFRSLGLFFLVSILAVISVRSFLLRFSDKKLLLSVLGCVFTAILIEKISFQIFNIQSNAYGLSSTDLIAAYNIWGEEPLNAAFYVVTALATGLVNPGFLIKAGLSASTVNFAWMGVGILYVSAMIVATFRIRNAQYIIPLVIMGVCTLTIIAAMLLRVQANHTGMFTSYWPRYISMRDIGFIGVFWVAALEFQKAQKFRFMIKYCLTPLVIVGLSSIAFIYHKYDHERSKYVIAADQKEQKAMIFMGRHLEQHDSATFRQLSQGYKDQQGVSMPGFFVRRIHPDHNRLTNIDLKGIDFLRQYSLNVFSDDYPSTN